MNAVCERPAGPGNLSVVCSNRLVVDVSWDVGLDASSYAATSTGGLAPFSDSDNGFTRRGEPGAEYALTVKSLVGGVWSVASMASASCPNGVDVSWAVLPDVSGLSLNCGADGWVRANWAAGNGADEYEVSGSFETSEIEATEMRWKGTSGALHAVRVRAWDLGHTPVESTWSDYARVKCPPFNPPER